MRALLIDDSKFFLLKLSQFLKEKAGVQVVACGFSGVDALSLYQTHKPDIVLMDISMPDKDGWEALEDIKGYDASAKVLIVSAIHGFTQEEVLAKGAYGYWQKPISFHNEEQVLELIKSLDRIAKESP
jgi:two-component system, chemotaxis family, chemotaxis protein CheY